MQAMPSVVTIEGRNGFFPLLFLFARESFFKANNLSPYEPRLPWKKAGQFLLWKLTVPFVAFSMQTYCQYFWIRNLPCCWALPTPVRSSSFDRTQRNRYQYIDLDTTFQATE